MGLRYKIKVIRVSENQGVGEQYIRTSGYQEIRQPDIRESGHQGNNF
jgi:hypothetical protein